MRKFLSITSLCWFAAGIALASPVYQQLPTYTPPDGTTISDWTISFAAGQGGFRTYDNFSLGATTTITAVEWFAFAWDLGANGANPTNPVTVDWNVAFFTDNGGAPGTQVYVEIDSPASV